MKKSKVLLILVCLLLLGVVAMMASPGFLWTDSSSNEGDVNDNTTDTGDDNIIDDSSGGNTGNGGGSVDDPSEEDPGELENGGAFSLWSLKTNEYPDFSSSNTFNVDFTFRGCQYYAIDINSDADVVTFKSNEEADLWLYENPTWYSNGEFLLLPETSKLDAELLSALKMFADEVPIEPVRYKFDFEAYREFSDSNAFVSYSFKFISNGRLFYGIEVNYLPTGGYYLENATNAFEVFDNDGFIDLDYSDLYIIDTDFEGLENLTFLELYIE